MMTGIEMIAAERERQQKVEEFDFAHDDEHTRGELSAAASAYVLLACDLVAGSDFSKSQRDRLDHVWPWDADSWRPSKDPIRNLTKAAALIAAEIDRIQRQAT